MKTLLHNNPARLASYAAGALAGLILLLIACNGFYQVRPGEAAAIQTFGAAKPEPVTNEGLHWHWPSPIGKTTVAQVRKSRTAEIGFQTLPRGKLDPLTQENWQRDLDAATMITGDLNLLETQLVAHYYISDLNAYLFKADDPGVEFQYTDGTRNRTHQSHPRGYPDGQTIKDSLEIAVRRAVGHRSLTQDPEFYTFLRTLESYQTSIQDGATLVLTGGPGGYLEALTSPPKTSESPK